MRWDEEGCTSSNLLQCAVLVYILLIPFLSCLIAHNGLYDNATRIVVVIKIFGFLFMVFTAIVRDPECTKGSPAVTIFNVIYYFSIFYEGMVFLLVGIGECYIIYTNNEENKLDEFKLKNENNTNYNKI